MGRYIFEIIILLFIVSIIIHFYCKKADVTEYLNKGTEIKGLDKTDIKWYRDVNKLVTNDGDIMNNKLIFDDNYEGNIKQNNSINLDKKIRKKSNNNKYIDKFNVKDYIRNNVLDGKSQCFCVSDKSKAKFTRYDVDKYREQQLKFQGEMIYGTSAPAIDPVDKMNIINMENGIKGDGKTIADVYDTIVKPY